MSAPLHTLKIKSKDGRAWSTEVMLDDRPLRGVEEVEIAGSIHGRGLWQIRIEMHAAVEIEVAEIAAPRLIGVPLISAGEAMREEGVRWRPGVPDEEGPCLVYAPSGDREHPFIEKAWWSVANSQWELVAPFIARSITHWQPLPKPPV